MNHYHSNTITVGYSWLQYTVTEQAFEKLRTYKFGYRVTVYSIKKINKYINTHTRVRARGLQKKVKKFRSNFFRILTVTCNSLYKSMTYTVTV